MSSSRRLALGLSAMLAASDLSGCAEEKFSDLNSTAAAEQAQEALEVSSMGPQHDLLQNVQQSTARYALWLLKGEMLDPESTPDAFHALNDATVDPQSAGDIIPKVTLHKGKLTQQCIPINPGGAGDVLLFCDTAALGQTDCYSFDGNSETPVFIGYTRGHGCVDDNMADLK